MKTKLEFVLLCVSIVTSSATAYLGGLEMAGNIMWSRMAVELLLVVLGIAGVVLCVCLVYVSSKEDGKNAVKELSKDCARKFMAMAHALSESQEDYNASMNSELASVERETGIDVYDVLSRTPFPEEAISQVVRDKVLDKVSGPPRRKEGEV